MSDKINLAKIASRQCATAHGGTVYVLLSKEEREALLNVATTARELVASIDDDFSGVGEDDELLRLTKALEAIE